MVALSSSPRKVARWAFCLLLIGTTLPTVAQDAPGFQLHVDASHPWLPPFGIGRIGRDLTVEIEASTPTRPTDQYAITGYAAGRQIEQQRFVFPAQAPFLARVTLRHWPDEVALTIQPGTNNAVDVERAKVVLPVIDVDAEAAADTPANPVDLGVIFPPADWLVLHRGGTGHVDVALQTRAGPLSDLQLSVSFKSDADTTTRTSVSLPDDERRTLRVPLPRILHPPDRDTLVVSVCDQDGTQLWRKNIPVMNVADKPNWPEFGATATKLRYDAPILVRQQDGSEDLIEYDQGWDSRLFDVVVSLPDGSRFVFWRGAGYVPFWAGAHNTGFTYEWAETTPPQDGFQDSVEPLMDKELRYGRVEIVESTKARVHVRWRYQACDFNYKIWGDWAVEDFYFYPDGFGTRVLTLTSTPGREYEVLEFIVLTAQSTFPLAALPEDMVDVLFLDGRRLELTFPFTGPAEAEGGTAHDLPAIWRVKLHKDDPRTAIAFCPSENRMPHGIYRAFTDRGQAVTRNYWGNHWPLARGKKTGHGINDGVHKGPAHNSIMTWGYNLRPVPLQSREEDVVDTLGDTRRMKIEQYAWFIGQTDEPDDRLLQRASGYAHPPGIDVLGGRDVGWCAQRRAFQLVVEQPTVVINVVPDHTVVNPVFELASAPAGTMTISVNSTPLDPTQFRWDGSTLWLALDIDQRTRVQIDFGP